MMCPERLDSVLIYWFICSMPQSCKPLQGLLAASCLDDPITTAAVLKVEVSHCHRTYDSLCHLLVVKHG
jgi:hypothetical protein